MNFELMIETFPKLLSGLNLTIQLVTISLFLGFCLAIGLALLRLSNNTFLSFFAKTQLQLLPGTHQITAACNTDRKGTMAGNTAGLYTTSITLEAGKHYFIGGNLKHLPRRDWKQVPNYNPLTKEIMGYDTITSECRLKLGV